MTYCNFVKLLLIFFIGVAPLVVQGQLISGKIYRQGTDSIIVNASVYYNGTAAGTVSNNQGYFEIVQQTAKIPIIVSCIGYYSATLSNYTTGTPLKVYLKPKVNELGGVTIRGKSSIGRADMERMFYSDFIGTSDNALSCTIANIDDIDLFYSRASQTLIATCNKPILIDNKRLAYRITYYLDHFKAAGRSVTYAGNSRFTDLATPANQKKISHNRQEAYDGSRMEFIRALHSKTLAKHGFTIALPLTRSPFFRPLAEDSIVAVNKASEQFVNLRYNITIIHNGENALATYLAQSIENCYIDKNGFYDTGLQWFGYMGNQRMGDLLPYEYQPPAK